MPRSRSLPLLRAALVAALVSVSALVAIPLGPVPVTLQVIAVAAAALLLTPLEALGALAAYAALGALGLPVFSGGSGGPGVVLGPTGGFIIGFVIAAPAGALVRRGLERTGRGRVLPDLCAVSVLVALTYASGLAWFVVVTGMNVADAATVAIVPFLAPDIVKAVAAIGIARAVRAAGFGDQTRQVHTSGV